MSKAVEELIRKRIEELEGIKVAETKLNTWTKMSEETLDLNKVLYNRCTADKNSKRDVPWS